MAEFYIDSLDDALAFERMESYGGGMDFYTRATLLAPDAYQYSENGVVPENFGFKTRPGTESLGGTPQPGGVLLAEDGSKILQESGGKILLDPVRQGINSQMPIQGLRYFDTPAVEQLIAAADGVLSYWDGNAWTEMTGWVLSSDTARFEAAQGVDKLLIVDGTDLRIWDGVTFSTAFDDNDTNPPKGATWVLWHAGRMWAAGFGGLIAGKENDAVWGSNLLAFGQGEWNKTDRNFRIGGGDGDPLITLASLSSSADKGFVMAALKQNSIWLVNADPRVPFGTYIAEKVSPDGVGIVGRRAFCVYGNDLLFVSPDRSIRSLARMQAAASQYQMSPPLSVPIQPIIDRINWDFSDHIAVVKYREYALFAVPLDASRINNAVLVWNGYLNKWIGIWTGWTPQAWEVTRFSGVNRLVFGDIIGAVPQWKDWKDLQDPLTYLDDDLGYPTRLWTRAMLFQQPLNDKDPYYVEERFAVSDANITSTIVADNADLIKWSTDIRQEGPSLPIPELPFDLVDTTNRPERKGLRGRRHFNEAFVKIESDTGFWELRNCSIAAFINTLSTR